MGSLKSVTVKNINIEGIQEDISSINNENITMICCYFNDGYKNLHPYHDRWTGYF